MPSYRTALHRGMFSLMELALVVTVLLIVATIVGPRVGRAEAPAAGVSPRGAQHLMLGRLAMLRAAIEEYATDHGGRHPAGDAQRVTRQLTQFSNRWGDVSPNRTRQFPLGPYLREIPSLPFEATDRPGVLGVLGQHTDDASWLYNDQTGRIRANTTDQDPLGRDYATY